MEKIKPIKNWIESEKGKDIFVIFIVILVGLGSFELGRLSKETGGSGVKIEYRDQNIVQEASAISAENYLSTNKKVPTTAQNSTAKKFFASSRGSKYYSVGCSGGKTIKQENRVYFASKEEAERAGYTISSSCR